MNIIGPKLVDGKGFSRISRILESIHTQFILNNFQNLWTDIIKLINKGRSLTFTRDVDNAFESIEAQLLKLNQSEELTIQVYPDNGGHQNIQISNSSIFTWQFGISP